MTILDGIVDQVLHGSAQGGEASAVRRQRRTNDADLFAENARILGQALQQRVDVDAQRGLAVLKSAQVAPE